MTSKIKRIFIVKQKHYLRLTSKCTEKQKMADLIFCFASFITSYDETVGPMWSMINGSVTETQRRGMIFSSMSHTYHRHASVICVNYMFWLTNAGDITTKLMTTIARLSCSQILQGCALTPSRINRHLHLSQTHSKVGTQGIDTWLRLGCQSKQRSTTNSAIHFTWNYSATRNINITDPLMPTVNTSAQSSLNTSVNGDISVGR